LHVQSKPPRRIYPVAGLKIERALTLLAEDNSLMDASDAVRPGRADPAHYSWAGLGWRMPESISP
jgi:hypothetical protein